MPCPCFMMIIWIIPYGKEQRKQHRQGTANRTGLGIVCAWHGPCGRNRTLNSNHCQLHSTCFTWHTTVLPPFWGLSGSPTGGGGGYTEGRSPALKAAVAHQRSASVGGCTAYAASHYDCTSYVLHVNRSDVCCVVILFMMLVLQYVGDVIKSGVLHMLHLEHDNARLVLLNF